MIYPEISSTVVLDNERVEGQRKVFINFDMTIKTACSKLHLDIFERDSEPKKDRIANITRVRIAESGRLVNEELEINVRQSKNKAKSSEDPNFCGPCYRNTTVHKCCNTCQDVIDVFKAAGLDYYSCDNWDQCVYEGVTNFGSEQCRIHGKVKVKKQSGYFHIAQGSNIHDSSRGHQHDLQFLKPTDTIDHTIKYLYIGEKTSYYEPPLTDVEMKMPEENNTMWMVSYFLHAVPEKLEESSNKIDSYRYSAFPSVRKVTKDMKKGYPGIVFYYDFTPMVVVSKANRPTIRDIIVDICGTIGGAFSFAAIIDALMFGALSTIQGKSRIGKDM